MHSRHTAVFPRHSVIRQVGCHPLGANPFPSLELPGAAMSSFFSKILDLVFPQRVQLPQKAGRFGLKRRNWQLTDARETYQFNYTHISSLAILDTVPIHDE